MPITGTAPNKTYTRTDGTRTGTNTWAQADAAGVDILSADHDTHDEDVATALRTMWMRDGGNQPTADMPFGGYKATGVGDATAATDALNRQTGDARYFLQTEAEGTIASAATTNIGAETNFRLNVTGTVTITSLGTTANSRKLLRFSDALTLTHNATTLILPGAANITTAAGDFAEFVSDGSGNWRCVMFTRADGSSLGGGGGLFKGNNGEVGSAPGDIFRINAQTLTVDTTIDADENASCTGPFGVSASATLTVNGNLTVV